MPAYGTNEIRTFLYCFDWKLEMNKTGIIFVSCKDSLALNIIYQQICPKLGKGTKKDS